jgi:putative phosphoesterase
VIEIAVIADTHLPRGRRRLPEACVERIRGADLLIHAGDFSTTAAYEEIAGLGPRLIAVHGNVDDAELVERLPQEATVEVGGARIAVVHDAGPKRGRLVRMRRRFADADAVVFGHSHLPLHEREGGFQIFNPGSPTERRRALGHTMGWAVVEGGAVRFQHVEL